MKWHFFKLFWFDFCINVKTFMHSPRRNLTKTWLLHNPCCLAHQVMSESCPIREWTAPSVPSETATHLEAPGTSQTSSSIRGEMSSESLMKETPSPQALCLCAEVFPAGTAVHQHRRPCVAQSGGLVRGPAGGWWEIPRARSGHPHRAPRRPGRPCVAHSLCPYCPAWR